MVGKKKVHNFATLLRARGRLAQLVQSVCLTSRGSGVRIPQRPQHQPRLNANRVLALERAAQKAEAADAAARQTLLRGTLRNRALKHSHSQKHHFGRLAQLVQSVCLTSRGSGVRIPQRPQPKSTPQAFHNGMPAFFVLSLP